jgi:Fic family protein
MKTPTNRKIAEMRMIPQTTAWYLSDLGEARGKQDLYVKQSPQRLKVLRQHALIESAVSSNRIEGVVVDQARVTTIVLGKSKLRDRNEEEVRGYRDALRLIHEHGPKLPVTEATILRLHRLVRGESSDAGKYKKTESDIYERYSDGRFRIRFKTVPAAQTPECIKQLLKAWRDCISGRETRGLLSLAAFNLDFLCIHPFRDGNGRVSRLLMLLQCYHLGFDVGRYISLERLIEQNKERYYETLEESSDGWHDGKHDPWPYINFLLYILKTAYREFEQRVAVVAMPRGAKTEIVRIAIATCNSPFRIAELQRNCPGVSIDLIRRVLKDLRASGVVKCLGRGQNAQWQRTKKANK